MKIFEKILLSLIFLLGAVFSESAEIKNITINPLNRAIIEFDSLPPQILSELSETKTLITLDLGNYKFNDNLKQKTGLGIISDIFIKSEAGTTKLNIKTLEKRGYTITTLPFTNSIIVEVFQWDRLSQAEELYRTGLLALEDKILDEAVKNLHNSSKQKFDDAVFPLAIAYLKSGYFWEAKRAFDYSYQSDSLKVDALAGLSLVLSQLGNQYDADNYSKQFTEKCNCNFSGNININYTQIDSSYLDLSHLVLADKDTNNLTDSLDINSDSLAIAMNDSLQALQQSEEPESIFKEIERYLIYAFVIVGGTFIALVFYYFKWRKAQLEKRKQAVPNNKFKESLQQATAKVTPNAVSNVYKTGGDNQKIDKVINDKPLETDDKGIINEDKLSKLGSVIESITGKPAETYKQTANLPNVNAKLQLAMHLADEQRKIKAQNIENLKATSIPNDKKKLAEVSQKLGIEKGGLETKSAIEKILKDKSKLKNLNDKFGS